MTKYRRHYPKYIGAINLSVFICLCLIYVVFQHYVSSIENQSLEVGRSNWGMFDKIYCIISPWNLDRVGPLKIELQRVGLENTVEFVDGILDNEHGHRGAWQAHKNVAVDALQHSYKRILVFEDDIHFTNAFVEAFEYKLYEL